jgi:tetratricopeptide (TPR) repeat protein
MRSFLQKLLITFWFLGSVFWAYGRVSVAVLPLQNLTEDKDAAHWSYMIPVLLNYQLKEVHAIRMLPNSSFQFAFRELKFKIDRNLTLDETRKIGEILEARFVIDGSYERARDNWVLNIRLIKVGTGETPEVLTARSSDWPRATFEIAIGVLRKIGVSPSRAELTRMQRPPTASPLALELVSRGYAASKQWEPIAKVLDFFQQACLLDKDFAMAQTAVAHCLRLQGKIDEAERVAKDAVKARPDYDRARATLGTIYLTRNLVRAARAEFAEAVKLAPDDASNFRDLSRTCSTASETISILRKAEKLAPFDAWVHAELAREYAKLRKIAEAQVQLAAAERYSGGEDGDLQKVIAESYDILNDLPKAVECYQNFVATAESLGMQQSLQSVRERLTDLKARLIPTAVTASVPEAFTPERLETVYNEKLTANERRLITNPLTSTPDMQKWADMLSGEVPEEIEKAKRLFNALTRHINTDDNFHGRTATEAFNTLSNPNMAMSCQDYTFLFIALARHVNLQAYYVLVERDYRGESVSHACAGVFIDGKAFMVDPNYRWFGVPHQKFEFQNDLRVIGAYLAQSSDAAKQKVGLKLVSDWSLLHFYVAIDKANRGNLREARALLQIGLQFDSESWLACYAQGAIAGCEKDWPTAVRYLQRSLAANPGYSIGRYQLGTALLEMGKLSEARDEYRTFLQHVTDPKVVADVRRIIARINEIIPEDEVEKNTEGSGEARF